MTIEITNPDVEALIRQRMRAGAFKNPEDLIQAVLRFSAPETRTGADLIAALQECPYPEGDIEASATLGGVQSAADIVLEEMRKVPADIMASLPRDGASQHDHYLYGWPQKKGMTAVFADTFHWVALADFSDSFHDRALALTAAHGSQPLVTTMKC